MLQDTGTGPTHSESPIFNQVMKLSPIVCALDTLSLLLELSYRRICTTSTLRQAAALTWRTRFSDGNRPMSKLPLWLHVIVFGLGALPQVLKLLACRGIHFSQAWAVLWTTSFITFELVAIAAATTENGHRSTFVDDDQLARLKYYRQSLVRFGILIHTLFLLFVDLAIQKQLSDDATRYSFPLPGPFLIYKLFGANLLFLGCPLLLLNNRHMILAGLVMMLGRNLLLTISGNMSEMNSFFPVLAVAIGILTLLFSKLIGPKKGEGILLLWTTLEMITIPWVYYCFLYDSKGTSKPIWTEQLG
jgi:hypothetical protein